MKSGEIELTLVLRPPPAAANVAAMLFAGSFDAAANNTAVAASPQDVAAVISFAASHHLEVLSTNAVGRSIHVTGLAADIEKAFGIEPGKVAERNYRGPLQMPEQLIAVLGLDHTPVARTHS